MKRMMIATALATTLGTAGFAATEAQIDQVQSFNASVDTSTFTDRDFDIAYGIVTSGMSTGEKTAKLRALATDDNIDTGLATISEAEMARLQDYAPDADFGSITQAQAEAALAITYGGESRAVITERVQSILEGAKMDTEMMAMVTTGQASMIEGYVPNADLSALSEDELALALSYIHSSMPRSEKVAKIESLLN
ncbi:hypothetical protein [Marivita geojedonensis]|uniref:Uncharacterized protein n=1 Tax=Marivita geojedonensis TaxID=1123756 RepID=A0A1X4NBP8_9RHOB|nr:hypothetical protein [Marivita geojedonensis]OSQ44087.1 hypothetical protein MGEO_19225 [Marivita geojedonensis]PRY72864.1 hypothetical protein CLV76_1337 [Marivita geojedonensis]